MVQAPPRPKPERPPVQQALIPEPEGDYRLLRPGVAGALTLGEAEYIAWHLAHDRQVRHQWGFTKRRRYSLAMIAERALPEDPEAGRRILANAQAERHAG